MKHSASGTPYIDEPVPVSDPESGLWRRADAQKIAMEGQAAIIPLKLEGSVKEITVRSLYDGETIAFLLPWEDAEKDEHTIKIDSFRDACGVFLGRTSSHLRSGRWERRKTRSPFFTGRLTGSWISILAFRTGKSHVSFDFYPPLVVTSPKIPEDYPEEIRNRLPGWSVGNPIAQPLKASPVKKLRAIGPSTLEHLATTERQWKGIWKNGRWKVALGKPMHAADYQEQTLEPGRKNALAFTFWSGAAGDRGFAEVSDTAGPALGGGVWMSARQTAPHVEELLLKARAYGLCARWLSESTRRVRSP